MLRDHVVSPARAALGALLVLIHLGTLASALNGAWQQTFIGLYVPAAALPFDDFRVISAGIESAAQGHDPMITNPADARGRPFNYPRVWLVLGAPFDGDGGAVVAGLLLAVMFSLSMGWVVAVQKTTGASIAISLLAFCSSTWLALERGNTDLAIFTLLALGLYIPWRYRGVLIGIAAVLKVYPVAASALKALRDRTAISVGIAVVAIAYLGVIYADLVRISQTTEVSGFLSFGIKSVLLLFNGTDLLSPTAIYTGFGLGTLIAFGLAFLARFKLAPSALEQESMALIGGMLLLCFVTGSNWDYRLIFFGLTIPYLLRPGIGTPEKVFGWVAVVLMLLAANFNLLNAVFGDLGILANVAAKYLLYCVLVFSVARILIQADGLSYLFGRRQIQ